MRLVAWMPAEGRRELQEARSLEELFASGGEAFEKRLPPGLGRGLFRGRGSAQRDAHAGSAGEAEMRIKKRRKQRETERRFCRLQVLSVEFAPTVTRPSNGHTKCPNLAPGGTILVPSYMILLGTTY